MAVGKAHIKFAGASVPDYLIVTWCLFTNQGAEIGRQSYANPHPERSLTVTNLDPVMHTFKFYRSTDGTTLTTLLLKMDIDCSSNETQFYIYDYVTDRGDGDATSGQAWNDPVSGGTTVNDQRLIGANFYVEQRGVGPLRPDEVTKDIVTGGFTILGQTFDPDDTWFAIVSKVVQQPSGGVPSSDYMNVVQISADVNFGSTHYRNFLECINSAVATISVPALSSIPNTRVFVNTHSMTGRYLVIAFSGADTAKLEGRDVSKVTLGIGEEAELLFTGTRCVVTRGPEGYRRLGMINFGRGIETNVLPLDGTTYQIADYPRLYLDFINRLPASQIKSMTAWATSQTINGLTMYPNKGFFAVDTGAGTFKVPDLRDRMVRGLKLDVSADTTRLTDHPGGFQMDMVGPHTHLAKSGWYLYGATGKGNLSSNNDAVRQTDANRTNDGLENNTGTETIPRNIGFIPQIFI
jgi:hypothetical protein